MTLLVPPRVDVPELLDEPGMPRDEIERSLWDLRNFNRWMGGVAIYGRLLRRFDTAGGAPPDVLDVGTGSSDLIAGVPRARLRVGLDSKIEHLLFDRADGSVLRVVGDATALPFLDGAVDVVTTALFFHHFGPEANAAILREAARVARRGVAVNDIVRNRIPLAFMWLLGALRVIGRITRHDAIASFRRAYTVEEARAIAEGAGAGRVEVVRAFPFRLGILLTK